MTLNKGQIQRQILHSVRVVQIELELLRKRRFVVQIGISANAEPSKINSLAWAAGVDIAEVASQLNLL